MPMCHISAPDLRLVKTLNALLHACAVAYGFEEALEKTFGCWKLGHENLLDALNLD